NDFAEWDASSRFVGGDMAKARKSMYLLIQIVLDENCAGHLQPLRRTVYDRENSRLAQVWLAGRGTRTQHFLEKVVGFFVFIPCPPPLWECSPCPAATAHNATVSPKQSPNPQLW